MPTAAVKKHFSFVRGLNTEGGFLTFPENTWSEGDNVIPSIDGSLVLRTCMDYEPSYELSASSLTTTQVANGAFVSTEWNNVGNNGNLHFLVVQRDTTVSFYTNSGSTISSQDKSFTIDLSSYKAPGNPETSGVAPISCTSANGNLIIVSADTVPLLVSYDADADDITVEEITLKIRDFIGQDDELEINERPATLSDEHKYNLLNQGWTETHINSYKAGSSGSLYPSNAQSWTAGKDTSDNFSASLLDKQDFGTSPSPRGRYILDLFSRDRATASGVAGIATETESYRPTTCAFFAGRAWYAGVRSTDIGAWVVFSQVAETTNKLGRCYQDADPTSEVISDLVPSDGGVIPIQDAGTVLKLLPFGNLLLVVCDNGIWQIIGGSDTGFAADAYEVRRLTTVGCVSAKSVVLTDQAVLYWSEDGVYIVQANENGLLVVSSISAESIQTHYNDIPMTGRVYSSGQYVPQERVVYWLYNDDAEQDGIQFRFKKNRVLCLDIGASAYYTMTIGELASNSPYILDLFLTKSRSSASTVYNVVDSNGDTVVDELGTPDQVVATQNPSVANAATLKFLTIHPASASSFNVTLSQFDDTHDAPRKFRDWYTKDTAGKAFTGYIVPGYDFGDNQGADRAIQALYVMVYMRRTETSIDANGDPVNPSSCLMRARWDWTDSAAGNRQGPQQQVYRHRRVWIPAVSSTFDDGHPVVVTKNKVRGRGKALQLRFESEEDKDMQLLGWAVTYIGNVSN